MSEVDPGWSLDSLLRNFRPHERWRNSFAVAYVQALESPTVAEQLNGWKTAAMILGDMHACTLCLFVCYHGCGLVPEKSEESQRFVGHINLCLWDMGLATPNVPEPVPVLEVGKPGTLRRDVETFDAWMRDQLQPFAGDLRRAAEFSMRLTAIRLGLLIGPSEPSMEDILDAALWRRNGLATGGCATSPSIKKKWWQLWK